MSCVISLWSPDLISKIFMTMVSDPSQYPFTLDDTFFPVTHRRKRFLDCVWVRLLPMGSKDHKQKMSYLTHSPYYPWEKRQNFEGIGEIATHGAKRLHTRNDNIMPIANERLAWLVYMVVWYLCDNLPFVRF